MFPKSFLQWRARLAVIAGLLVIATSLWRCFTEMSLAEVAANLRQVPRQSHSWFETTFTQAHAHLSGHDLVGYVATDHPQSSSEDDRNASEWVRYALAPNIVEKADLLKHHLFVTYFDDDSQLHDFIERNHLRLMLRIDIGCALLKRDDP